MGEKIISKKECLVTPKNSTISIKKQQLNIDDSNYVLIHYKTTEDITFDENTELTFKFGKVVFPVKADFVTTFCKEFYSAGEEIAIISHIDGDKCVARMIISKEQYDLFRCFENYEDKISAIQFYNNLSKELQQSIAKQISGEKSPFTVPAKEKITDVDGLRFKYDMCRDTYTPQQQADIKGLLEESKRGGSGNREKTLRRLRYILNIDQTFAQKITLTKEEIVKGLDKYIYKMDKAKEMFAQAVVASKYSNEKGMAILLVGSPGVGKTYFMEAASRVINYPFFNIPLGTVTSMVDIIGTAQHYDSSDCGEVVKNFYNYGTTAVVVGLDEYGNAANLEKEGGKVSKAFNDALSDVHFFKDSFLGTYINTSNTIFIATTNSTETIPENLLNRFQIIHIDDYTEEEKVEIAYNYVLPDILSSFNIKRDEITISKDNLAYIADNYCEDDGARDMKKHLQSLVRGILSVWDSTGKRKPVIIERKYIDASLRNCVDKDSPIIIYRRNKEMYSPKASEEIKLLIDRCRRDDLDVALREKYEKKLKYLVYAIPAGNAFSAFDEDEFYAQVNKTHYGLEDVKKDIAQTFYISSIMGKPLTSNRILLVGPPGIGKTSIVKSIAKACNAKYSKVSLNGVSDDAIIKGHSLTYVGADAGVITKSVYSMKTTKGIIQLDEIDKMGTREGIDVSNSLFDLLDDSAEFTDNFLGIPTDFSNTLFIATANDISAINQPLKDRFTIIYLEGYTEHQKAIIIEKYLIPKVTSELTPKECSISFSEDAKELLVKSYCKSFGVRDAERVVRKIVKDKLYTMRNDKQCRETVIDNCDIVSTLGKPTVERGNFPCEKYPGLSRALAVTGDNCGMSFAIETMLLPEEDSFTITGLPKESTVDSVKLATSYIKRNYPGIIKDKGIHIHFGEGAVPKDGPSAGVAILMSMLSAALDIPIYDDVAYTGEINGNGYVFNIGGTISKIQAAEQANCSKVFIPYGNYIELKEDEIKQFSIEIVPVKHVSEVISAIFPTIDKVIKK